MVRFQIPWRIFFLNDFSILNVFAATAVSTVVFYFIDRGQLTLRFDRSSTSPLFSDVMWRYLASSFNNN